MEELEHAQTIVDIVSVQNLYNLSERKSEKLLDYCTEKSIGFIPWFPVAGGDLVKPGGVLDQAAKAHGATVAQLALAWLLKRSPGHAADPRHVVGGAPGREHRVVFVDADRRRVRVAECAWEVAGSRNPPRLAPSQRERRGGFLSVPKVIPQIAAADGDALAWVTPGRVLLYHCPADTREFGQRVA